MLPIRLTSAALPLIKALDVELGKENPSETIINDKLQALNGSMGWDRFYKAPLRWESTPGSGWTQASSQYQMMKLRLMYGCPFRHETVGNEVAGLLYPAEQESIGLLQVCCGMDTVILPPLDYKCLRYEVHEPLLEGLMFGIWVPHKRFYECGACGIPIPLDNGPPNLSNIISSGTGSARPDYDGPKALDLQRLVEALGNHVHNYQRHLYNAGHYLQYFGPDDMEPRPFTLKLYPFCFMDHPFFTSGITAQAMLDHLNWHRLPTPVAALAQALWYYISNNYNLGAYVHKKAGRLIVWQLCSDEFARGVVSSDTPFELRRGTCPYDRRVHEALQGLADFNYAFETSSRFCDTSGFV
ncbi:hypothetical protein FOL47_002077 [Perkinsus chesapeaki]|uniref:Uncharacterized protein n=1 Tax=Perkinsus chesapeaki TaxID=330153 RepID=A0A7J6KQ77_PERCH|nr:hypothetical protein FOL47_002077 [Perkinsus chesapeaki]